MFRPGMRAYIVPLVAGSTLTISAFLPWIHIGDVSLEGMTEMAALWVLALGALAAIFALLSLITRRNSRHPILVVGLTALAIMFLSWRILPRLAGQRAQTVSQAAAIVENRPMAAAPATGAGIGIYLGLAASAVIVLFGLTIVVRRASHTYVLTSPDDDV